MLISHDQKFVYITTAKPLTWDVMAYFERYCLPPGGYTPCVEREPIRTKHGFAGARSLKKTIRPDPDNHLSNLGVPEGLINIVGPHRWPNYFKFAVVRNPFDLCVAWFHAWMPDYERERLEGLDFAETRKVFRDWMTIWPQLPRFHRPITYKNELFLDDFIRFEAQEAGMKRVCEALNLAYDPAQFDSPYVPPAPFRPWKDYYDDATKGVIRDEFTWELKTFGYEFES